MVVAGRLGTTRPMLGDVLSIAALGCLHALFFVVSSRYRCRWG